MNKKELINTVSKNAEFTKKDVTIVVDNLFETIMNSVKNGEDVSIVGFGSFSATDRKAREGYNPATGEKMKIKATRTPHFKAGKTFKEMVISK